ncbi:hypothetical protein VTK73DRAFT_1835 [Phialemonium thermophilum]|uniref:Calpain catalytic domain-containing protein n=1 Tax=Phialemonium thermophilum TaxID=223376 RepID=A0ABR3X869_9PEZI
MAAPLPPISGPAPIAAPGQKKDFTKTPQEIVSEFWDKYFAKKPGRVTSIFPRALYETLLPDSRPRGLSSAANAAESYEAAARECREKVRRIVRECNRTNEKFTDPDFDIEADPNKNCLNGLVRDESGEDEPHNHDHADHAAPRTGATTAAPHPCQETPSGTYETAFPNGQGQAVPRTLSAPLGGRHGVRAGETYEPGSVHRVDWIFESPKFTVEGYSSSDIKQGGNGDCWWLAAVATIAHRKDLMDRVCVARDEDCGVYGFVFQRDGEWVSVVVDDNLYLLHPDFDYYGDTYDATGRRAREHRRRYQTGSEALYFARCADPNETWLPLLEKAYAKVHGDYEAISGGWSGEGVEDMTGGVTTTIATNRVLKKDKLWRELVNSDGDFVFALSAIGTGWDWKKGGLALGHAYSVLRATEEVDEEGNKVRLVKIRYI